MKTNQIKTSINKNKISTPLTNKVKWEAKCQIILNEIAKGTTYKEIAEKYKDEWGCTFNTMLGYIKEASYELFDDTTKESLKQVNLIRLDSAYGNAIKNGDLKTALKAIDTQNKMIGAYEQKLTVDSAGDIDVTFNF